MIDLDAQSNLDSWHYTVLSAQFALLDADCNGAEAQGVIYGLLCSNIPVTEESLWLPYVIEADRENPAYAPLLKTIRQLYDRCDAVLQNPSDGFWMLLPEDTAPLAERTRALASWCKGFLLGLLGPTENGHAAFADEARELIDDLLAISEVAEVDGAGAETVDDQESEERALFEIQEYVKVAAQYLYEVTSRTTLPNKTGTQ